jgi:GntR family transcriptional regulator
MSSHLELHLNTCRSVRKRSLRFMPPSLQKRHGKIMVKLLRISRLIFLQGKPLVWTQTYLYVSEDFHPSKREVEKVESVFMLLEKEIGIFISRGDHQICVSSATSMDAELLGIKNGDPVLVIETKLYTRNDRLIGWRRAVHRADDYKFSITVNR